MRPVVVFLLLVIGLHLVPTVRAGGELQAGPLVVEDDDRRTSTCQAAHENWCLLHVDLAQDPGNSTVDLTQGINFVGVGLDRDGLPTALQAVPDEEIVLKGRNGYLPNPITPLATDLWTSSPLAPGVPGVFELEMDYGGIMLGYPLDKNNLSLQWHEFRFDWTNGQQGVGYDQIGPFNEPGYTSSDEQAQNASYLTCMGPADTRECFTAANSTISAASNATPNVIFGAQFETMEVATNSSALNEPTWPLSNDTPHVASWPTYSPPPHVRAWAGPTSPSQPPKVPPPAPEGGRHGFSAVPPPGTPPGPKPATGEPRQRPRPPPLLPLAVGGVLVAAAAAFYSRILEKENVLTSPARHAIMQLVRENPGTTLAEASRLLGSSRNTVLHHVRLLTKSGHVVVSRHGPNVYLAPRGVRLDLGNESRKRTTAQAEVLEFLRGCSEGVTTSEIATHFENVPRRTLLHTLAKLQEAGVVGPDGRIGRLRRWVARAAGETSAPSSRRQRA